MLGWLSASTVCGVITVVCPKARALLVHQESPGSNATRLLQHYLEKHTLQAVGATVEAEDVDMEVAESAVSSSSSSGASSPGPSASQVSSQSGNQSGVKQLNIKNFMDRGFTSGQMDKLADLLALWQSVTGCSHNSLQLPRPHLFALDGAMPHPLFKMFVHSLRPSFKTPSAYKLKSRQKALASSLQGMLKFKMEKMKMVALTIDGWNDQQHMEVLGCTIMEIGVESPKPLLVDVRQMSCRQTGDNIKAYLSEVINKIQSCGPQVLAVMSDNGANMLQAIRQLTEESGVVQLNCFAHCGQLLLKSVSGSWYELFAKAEAVETFFRTTSYPNGCYREEMQRLNASGLLDKKFTCLRQSVSTRTLPNTSPQAPGFPYPPPV